jgi:alkylation response protein AidB-like acyl-CoA dehydrogenase
MRDAVVRGWMDAEAYSLNTYATASRLIAGGTIGAEASLNKIFWSEMDLAMHESALALLGPCAELLEEAPAAGPGARRWLDGFLFSLAGPIYAGTNEIQRNVIAERLLGLPRK